MTDCIYADSAGKSAWDESAPLPPPLRRLLGLIEATSTRRCCKLLRQHTEGAIADWAASCKGSDDRIAAGARGARSGFHRSLHFSQR